MNMEGLEHVRKVKHAFNHSAKHRAQVLLPCSHFPFRNPCPGEKGEEEGLFSMIFLDRFLMEYLLSFLPP